MSEFARIEIKVGRIMEAQGVEKSNKLVLLKVDVGRPVQIVAGIALAYKPEDLVGKYIAVVTNLKPAKLMGLASEGMLLATDSQEGKLTLLSFDEPPKVGARIR
ncbi:MAG TPA: methionine--tRNA ligase subunit beta [Deltaproteobacteria bacterium]|nr:methionine--tRNA ligase subunit beta [Deltaproteobacteria bacterium]